VRFTVEDIDYDVDVDHLTYDELEFVHDHTGLGLWEFTDGLRRAVPKAIRALVILGKRRAGAKVRWEDFDGVGFDMSAAALAVLEGMFRPQLEAAQAEGGGGEGAAADPTPPPEPSGPSEPGTSPAPAETTT